MDGIQIDHLSAVEIFRAIVMTAKNEDIQNVPLLIDLQLAATSFIQESIVVDVDVLAALTAMVGELSISLTSTSIPSKNTLDIRTSMSNVCKVLLLIPGHESLFYRCFQSSSEEVLTELQRMCPELHYEVTSFCTFI